ncbi:hypothetical protein [Lewinella sp. 4G2]|uniref:hypothetical protein n=1 Tax=Lewinella sp. 4G2 TaxID=1803372 RepID=UPI0007B4CB68|nr:hypothetical protein [Lewinella sp. 4G2]OAV42630.1 hypothetical protein A3850_015400 [Lewinella sp. 4G2]
MRTLVFCLSFCLSAAFFSCENEYENVVPTIEDQEISFTVDGQSVSFKALPDAQTGPGAIEYDGDQPSTNRLSVARADATGNTTINITANNLPLAKTDNGLDYVGQTTTPATIVIRSTEMSGSIYCPHVEASDVMTYEGQISFEKIAADGTLKGTFSSGKRRDGNPKLEAGVIDVKLSVTER